MSLTPEVRAEILATFRQNRSPFKTSRKVGVDIADVFAVIGENEANLSVAPERNGGFGRPELQTFLVARRKGNEGVWDNAVPEVATARTQFEAGTHILATGRDGSYRLLYAIPRKGRPEPKPDYFKLEVA